MVVIKLPDIISGSMFGNILSRIWYIVLEWLVILVGCEIKGINELDARESKNSFVGLYAHCNSKLLLKLVIAIKVNMIHEWMSVYDS